MARPIHLKDPSNDARIVQGRVVLAAAVVLLLTAVLVARLYHLQVTQFQHHTTLSENNRVHVQPVPPAAAGSMIAMA